MILVLLFLFPKKDCISLLFYDYLYSLKKNYFFYVIVIFTFELYVESIKYPNNKFLS